MISRPTARVSQWRAWLLPVLRLRIETPLAFEDAHVRVAAVCAGNQLDQGKPVLFSSGELDGWARFGAVRMRLMYRDTKDRVFTTLVVQGKIEAAGSGSLVTLWLRPPVQMVGFGALAWCGLLSAFFRAGEHSSALLWGFALYALVCGGFVREAARITRLVSNAFG